MDRFKKEAFLKEFPCLSSFIPENLSDLGFIRIKRLDKEVLSYIYSIKEVTGSIVGIYKGEEAFCILSDGEVVPVRHNLDFSSNYAYTDPYHTEGETPLECLDRFQRTDLQYLVVVEYGIDTIDHYSSGRGITLYKLPKEFCIESLLNKARADALSLVQAEANF